MAHPRAKLTVQGRRLLVERIRDQGWPVPRAAEAQGVSVATAYKWLRRSRLEGDAGLADRCSRPGTSPRRLPPERERAILDHRAAYRLGPHRIAWALGEAPSTVYAVLRRHHAPRLADLDRPTGQVVRYQRQRPGELVHLDVKKQGRIPDGGGHRVLGAEVGRRNKQAAGYDFVHVAVDDCSRVAYLEVHPDERGVTVAGFAARALAFYASVGVRHKRTRPYRPQTNGKAERLNRTLAVEWAYARPYASNRARLDALPAWLHRYNHHRPHRALEGRSPMQLLNNVPKTHT
jgi:transposase InsO family protein